MKKKFIEQTNTRIRMYGDQIDAGKISDGYHTFDELYKHRIELYVALCKTIASVTEHKEQIWVSRKHSDKSAWKGWFIMGIGTEPGEQITYHLPDRYWDKVIKFAKVRATAPKFDGHTPADVLTRLKKI